MRLSKTQKDIILAMKDGYPLRYWTVNGKEHYVILETPVNRRVVWALEDAGLIVKHTDCDHGIYELTEGGE